MFWLQVSLQDIGDKRRLVLSRLVPDPDATTYPEFADEDKTIIADDIADLKISYFGPQNDMTEVATQKITDFTWQERWEDRRSMPLLVKLEVQPKNGPAWPDLIVEPKMHSSAGCTWDDFHKRCVYV